MKCVLRVESGESRLQQRPAASRDGPGTGLGVVSVSEKSNTVQISLNSSSWRPKVGGGSSLLCTKYFNVIVITIRCSSSDMLQAVLLMREENIEILCLIKWLETNNILKTKSPEGKQRKIASTTIQQCPELLNSLKHSSLKSKVGDALKSWQGAGGKLTQLRLHFWKKTSHKMEYLR